MRGWENRDNVVVGLAYQSAGAGNVDVNNGDSAVSEVIVVFDVVHSADCTVHNVVEESEVFLDHDRHAGKEGQASERVAGGGGR